MSVNVHEGPQWQAIAAAKIEKGAKARLADLEKLMESPIVPLVFAQAHTLSEQGKDVRVGISTNQAVTEGAEPTICIIINPTRHGKFGNEYHPERWDFGRVDLVGHSIGDGSLRVTVSGDNAHYAEPGMPHKITAMEEVGSALDQALLHPRQDSTRIGQDLRGFPVRGFERLAIPAAV